MTQLACGHAPRQLPVPTHYRPDWSRLTDLVLTGPTILANSSLPGGKPSCSKEYNCRVADATAFSTSFLDKNIMYDMLPYRWDVPVATRI